MNKDNVKNRIPCWVVGEYYTPSLREMAKGIKAGDMTAIRMAAREMASLIPAGAVLVPIPSHTGKAVQTRALAEELAVLTGTRVVDLLSGRPRQSSYELKYQGVVMQAADMGFRLNAAPDAKASYFLVDNVVASGNTAKAGLDLIPRAKILALAIDSRAPGRLPDVIVERCLYDKKLKDLDKMKDKQGMILVTSGGTTLAADFYHSLQQKDKIWHSWVDVAIAKSQKDHQDMVISDYPTKISQLKTLTDRQIGFILRGEKPERSVSALQAVFAQRNGVERYDAAAVSDLVRNDSDKFRTFMSQADKLTARLNTCKAGDEAEVTGYTRLRRLFELKGHLSFMGNERITTLGDVSSLFAFLQDKSVENSFVVMTRGNESAVIHLSIGTIAGVPVDVIDVQTAAERFGAEKVWFVHNHPSGNIYASKLDMQMHERLRELLGHRLQPSVIINTDTGKFGVFDQMKRDSHEVTWYTGEHDKQQRYQIPVYAFDAQCFKEKGLRRYTFNHSQDVATFLSTQRVGERYKYSLIVINTMSQMNGYYHLPYADLKGVTVSELAEYLKRLCNHSMGRGMIIVGYDTGELMAMGKQLEAEVNRVSQGQIKLFDVIHINERKIMHSLSELSEEKPETHLQMAGAGEAEKLYVPDSGARVTNAVIIGQKPMVRCQIDGVQQSARPLDRRDIEDMSLLQQNADALKRFAHSMAVKHFSAELKQDNGLGQSKSIRL